MKKDNKALNDLDQELNLFMHSQVPEVEPEDTDTIHPDYQGIPMVANIPFKEPGPEAYGILYDPVSPSDPSKMVVIKRVVEVDNQPSVEYVGKDQNSDLFMAQAMATSAFYGAQLKEETAESKSNLEKNIAKLHDPGLLQQLLDYKPKQRCYIGIDNGVSGSIGIIREDGTYAFHKTPVRSELNYTKEKAMITRIKPVDLTKLLSEAGPGSMVMIERPMVNPKMFKASTSALRAFEATIVVLETLGLAYEVCDSKEWQRGTLPKGVSGDALKPASMDVGNRLYPDAQSVKHPDRDGMLIAHHCKIKHR